MYEGVCVGVRVCSKRKRDHELVELGIGAPAATWNDAVSITNITFAPDII